MKHIKIFEDFSDKLYQVISEDEFDKIADKKFEIITQKEMDEIIDFLVSMGNRYNDIVDTSSNMNVLHYLDSKFKEIKIKPFPFVISSETFSMRLLGENGIFIFKLVDEWFYVFDMSDYTYYKCDSMEGLLNYLKSNCSPLFVRNFSL